MRTRLFLCFMVLTICLQAAEIPVTSSTFSQAYESASDGDVLLLSEGTYGGSITLPVGKTITLKAAEGAEPVIGFTISGAEGGTQNGGLILDGLHIRLNSDYFIDVTASQTGDISEITVLNSSITGIGRCFLQTREAGYSIGKIAFDNCIIYDCGANGYNFLYPKHIVKEVSVKNSTLYNYFNGESLFLPNQADTENVFTFTFENNTVYKWAKSSDRALCKTEKKYNISSVYIFRNNIVTEPGVEGETPNLLHATGGNLIAENNLIVNYGGYNIISAESSSINDLTLADLGMDELIFPDADGGDFSVVSDSPLANAGVGGSALGDPRWIKVLQNPVLVEVEVTPEDAGEVTPGMAYYEAGDQVRVVAQANFGYVFKEWQNGTGQVVSTENPYSFEAKEDIRLIAVFEATTTYELKVNREGDGAKWGVISLSPEPTDNRYAPGTIVNITIIPNPVTNFLYWEDYNTTTSRQILMDSDKEITATFDVISFIVGWDFNQEAGIRGNREGDYFFETDNRGLINLHEGSGSTTNWGASTKTFGGITYDCARRYTDAVNMDDPRYFVAKFSAKEYENIKITSLIASDNTCVHTIQKMQYSIDGVNYIDLQTIDMTPHHNTVWVECSAELPELTQEQRETIYIRWIGHTEGGLLGTPGSTDTEGFYLANVFIYGDQLPDTRELLLLSTVPTDGSTTASANGSIVFSFNKKVQSGDVEVIFNGQVMEPVFGSRTVTYPYKDLEYGTTYTFTLPKGAVKDLLGYEIEEHTIQFTTMERAQPIPRLFDAVIDKNGTGDYTTIQEAIDAMPSNLTSPWLIFVKNGSYQENIVIPATKSFIHLIGQDKEKTIIHEKINVQGDPENDKDQSYYANSLAAWEYSVNNPVSHHYQKEGAVVRINSSDFYTENITYRNDWGVEAQNGPQALALKTMGDRATFYNCIMRSFQDTWQTTSTTGYRHFAKDCFIEGAVDYIYGSGDVYVENSTLYNVRAGSVIVAPNHKEGTEWGYVFERCIIDGNAASNDGKTKLGRPWHEFPMVAYLNTTMKINMDPEGWTDMGGFPKRFAEYNSMDANGDPVDLSNRKTEYWGNDEPGVMREAVAVLTTEEAAGLTYENVLSGADDWNPKAYFEQVAKPANVTLEGNKLSWDASDYAICYIIIKDEVVIGFTTDTEFEDTGVVGKESAYKIQAVNEYGSLSEAASVGNEVSVTEVNSEHTPLIYKTQHGIKIENTSPDDRISLFSLQGQKVINRRAGSESVEITASGLKGVYILQVGSYVVKVIL